MPDVAVVPSRRKRASFVAEAVVLVGTVEKDGFQGCDRDAAIAALTSSLAARGEIHCEVGRFVPNERDVRRAIQALEKNGLVSGNSLFTPADNEGGEPTKAFVFCFGSA